MIRRYAKQSGVLVPLSPLLEYPTFLTRYPGIAGTTPAVAYADGTWVEVVASAPANSDHIIVTLASGTSTSGSGNGSYLEIGFGAAGAETQVGVFEASSRNTFDDIVNLPFPIPAGTRVSVRMRSSRTSAAWSLTFAIYSLDNDATHLPDSIAFNPAACVGVALAVPAANDGITWGAWTEIIASTANAYVGLQYGIGQNKQPNTNVGNLQLQLATGAAGSEVAVADNYFTSTASESISEIQENLVPINIPAGTRIAARYRRNAATNCSLSLNGVRT